MEEAEAITVVDKEGKIQGVDEAEEVEETIEELVEAVVEEVIMPQEEVEGAGKVQLEVELGKTLPKTKDKTFKTQILKVLEIKMVTLEDRTGIKISKNKNSRTLFSNKTIDKWETTLCLVTRKVNLSDKG